MNKREYMIKWRAAHREQIRAYDRVYQRNYYKTNRPKVRERRRKWEIANREKVRAYKHKWAKSNPEKMAAKSRRWSKANPEKMRARNRRYAKANPEKILAHYALRNAIRRGELIRQPCEICGNSRSHAHHNDYSKPFQVRWLCALHHKFYHLWLRELRRSETNQIR